MKRIGQIILSLLGVAVLAMAFSLAVPRAVHSQLASPAQVSNFPNNPVPVMNVNDPGRKPSFATSGTTTSANCTDTFTCQFSFVPVPAGGTTRRPACCVVHSGEQWLGRHSVCGLIFGRLR